MGEIILPVEASSSPLSVSVTDVSVTSYLLSRTTRLAPIQSKALFTTAAAMSPVQSDLLGERSLSQGDYFLCIIMHRWAELWRHTVYVCVCVCNSVLPVSPQALKTKR